MPSESNGKLLSAAMNRQFMLHLLEDSRAEFEEGEYNKVHQSILASEVKSENEAQKRLIYRDIRRSIYNGFGQLCVEKVSEMAKFFICKEGGVFPTKLNKEMFYADFLHYKLHGQSISGLQYQAIQYGPVPVHYDTVYDNIDGISKNIVVAHDMESTKLSSGSCNTSVFSEQELKTLNDVLAIIQPMSTQEIIDKSHKEDAWLRYRDGNQLIPFFEAFSIQLV